jgi:hypothetical protein
VIDQFSIRLGRMKTRIFDWAQRVDEWRQSNNARMVLITLTYRKVSGYRAGHIGDYLRNIKKRLKKDLYAFAWVAELQERGAVHYHIVLVVRPGADIPKPDKKGYWTHGMSKIETARTAFYLATYTGKLYQKDLSKYPKSCRLYAVSIRSDSGIKMPKKGTLQYKNNPKIRTAEGGAIWEYGSAGTSESYVRMMTDREGSV